MLGIQLNAKELWDVEQELRAARLEPAALNASTEPMGDQPVTIIRQAFDDSMIEAASFGVSLYEFVSPSARPGELDPGDFLWRQPNRFPRGMAEVDRVLDTLRDRVLLGPNRHLQVTMPTIPVAPAIGLIPNPSTED